MLDDIFNYTVHAFIAEKCNQEIEETMLKARDAKYYVMARYSFVEQLLLGNQTF